MSSAKRPPPIRKQAAAIQLDFFLLAQQRQHTGLGAGTHGLTHQLALLEHQQGGDAHHPELRRQIEAKVTEFLGMHPQEFTPGEEDLDDGSAAMSDLD